MTEKWATLWHVIFWELCFCWANVGGRTLGSELSEKATHADGFTLKKHVPKRTWMMDQMRANRYKLANQNLANLIPEGMPFSDWWWEHHHNFIKGLKLNLHESPLWTHKQKMMDELVSLWAVLNFFGKSQNPGSPSRPNELPIGRESFTYRSSLPDQPLNVWSTGLPGNPKVHKDINIYIYV